MNCFLCSNPKSVPLNSTERHTRRSKDSGIGLKEAKFFFLFYQNKVYEKVLGSTGKPETWLAEENYKKEEQ